MESLNFFEITFTELLVLILLYLLILSPSDVRKISKLLKKIFEIILKSKTWQSLKTMEKEIGNLPKTLMRDDIVRNSKDGSKTKNSNSDNIIS